MNKKHPLDNDEGHKQFSTPYRNRRRSSSGKCFAPFKAPTPTRSGSVLSKKDKIALAKQVLSLKQKKDELDEEISELEQEYSEEELDLHITKLHEYNDIKDVGQMLLGRLAELQRTTTKSLYEKYGLDLDD
eukprot:gene15954-17559_t